MRVLLVSPASGRLYHASLPPLGLLKLASLHKSRGDVVRLVFGAVDIGEEPDLVYITSLYTYAYKPVHDLIRFYRSRFRRAKIVVGGVYASCCSDHLKEAFGDSIVVYRGVVEEAEELLPDYALVPGWKSSMVFSSRGCPRRCGFCSASIIEPEFKAKKSIRGLIYPGHKKIILLDNNFLASPHRINIFEELLELGHEVDINQGLDARLMSPDVADYIRRLKMKLVKLGYDSSSLSSAVRKSVEMLKDYGISSRSILVYCLFNFNDSPDDLLFRLKDVVDMGAVAYPMRYEPIEPRQKATYISKGWTADQLELVAKARRIFGTNGAFPPTEFIKKKFLNARTFEEAFYLTPKRWNKNQLNLIKEVSHE